MILHQEIQHFLGSLLHKHSYSLDVHNRTSAKQTTWGHTHHETVHYGDSCRFAVIFGAYFFLMDVNDWMSQMFRRGYYIHLKNNHGSSTRLHESVEENLSYQNHNKNCTFLTDLSSTTPPTLSVRGG